MALTPKKSAFVDAVRGGASNKDAAIAAGYAASSAAQSGARLAKDPFVMAALTGAAINKKANKFVKGSPPATATPATSVGQDRQAEEQPGEGFDLSKALRFSDPKDFLLATMNDFEAEAKLRVDAAKALMPFVHPRKGESGKKEAAKDKAAGAAQGKFGVRKGPLAVVK
ncbi:terminase small subunit [Pseudomonas syringae pv. syringae]|uniref:terminase n=1 Tax=Pseudomonas syringae TaxID=317 RepID=UPI000BB62142|nr:terminase [Pseudomonas syringae]MCH5548220.1 terminase small subunit [Pseudomonas syringae pv. syringae]MCH5568819.1 terminase small subunit [Pseudomonas syringae pv. syringae]PBP63558.1 terminase [Pseudomonas syringae]